MSSLDKMVWLSFNANPKSGIVTSMTYAVGMEEPKIWRSGMPCPKCLNNPILDEWLFIVSDTDREIWECVMEVDHAWPPIKKWLHTQDIEKAEFNA